MFSAMTGLFKYLQYPNHNLLFARFLQACFALLTPPSSIVQLRFEGNNCAGICDLVSQQAAASAVANGLEDWCTMGKLWQGN
jgi:hypothetical protein